MKKKLVMILLAASMTAGLCGCDTNKADSESAADTETAVTTEAEITVDETEGTETVSVNPYEYDTPSSFSFDLNPDDYVTSLADYSAIPVSISASYEVTEENELDYLYQVLANYGADTEVEVTDRDTVEAGDFVMVDYVGKVDGEAFDGGSAEDQLIDVSGNCAAHSTSGYIDGFSDSLLGAKVGDTIDAPVTFPEDYSSTDLAGQDAVFTFTVKGIYRTTTFDDLTDDEIKELIYEDSSIDTVQGLHDYIDDYLEYEATDAAEDGISDYMIENSTVEVPEDYLEARLNEWIYKSIALQYCSDGETLDDVLATNGTDLETILPTWRDYVEELIKNEWIFRVIAEKEGIEMDDAMFEERIESMVSYYSYEDADAMYEDYGNGNIDDGKAYLQEQYLAAQALERVTETAVITYE